MTSKTKRASATPDRVLTVDDPLLAKSEAAALLGVTERWVNRAILERTLPYIKVGKLVRIRRSDVLAFIEAQTHPAKTGGR